MDSKKLEAFIRMATKKDPHPILIISYRDIVIPGNPKKICGVFESWNGESIFFSRRITKTKGGCVIDFPMGIFFKEVASIRVPSPEELAFAVQCLFNILDDFEVRKRELSGRR